MGRIDRPRLTLPEGDYIDTAWIPELLAEARWADDDGPKMVTWFWVPDGGVGFTPMSERDEALLHNIWQGLPKPVLPMMAADWQPYADVYNNTKVRPKPGLRWNVDDPQFNVRMKRTIAKQDYQKILAAEIQQGVLEVRSEGTLAVVPPPASGTRKLLVTREALKGFIERLGFEVVDKPDRAAGKPRNLRDDAVKATCGSFALWQRWAPQR